MLKEKLLALEARGYKAYKSIRGSYDIEKFTLFVDHVQGDPYARASRMRIRLDASSAAFPESLISSKTRKIAAEDYLTRIFALSIKKYSKGKCGSGKSGLFLVDEPGQEILERTSCSMNKEYTEIRFEAGLPAEGRRIKAKEAVRMLLEELPLIAGDTLYYSKLPAADMELHISTAEIQDKLRGSLKKLGLCAFIGNGSVLPRKSGISEKPLLSPPSRPFESPPELKTDIKIDKYGIFSGMGLPCGIHLLSGGAYHGKTTLLKALAKGIYDHIPGDGRELVVSSRNCAESSSENGRFVEKVNISSFVSELPDGQDTSSFSTRNASGSTSQASGIIEFIEAGADLLLIDEDNSAGNFLARDRRMKSLVPEDKEPVIPLIDRVRHIYERRGVSVLLVSGASGAFFDVCDRILLMEDYKLRDATDAALVISRKIPFPFPDRDEPDNTKKSSRIPLASSLDPSFRNKKVKIKADMKTLQYGFTTTDISFLRQFISRSQIRAAAAVIAYCRDKGYFDGNSSMPEALIRAEEDMDSQGLDVIWPEIRGDLVRPRLLETAALLNRMPCLKINLV
jgi:predicted ABC-class ATPase